MSICSASGLKMDRVLGLKHNLAGCTIYRLGVWRKRRDFPPRLRRNKAWSAQQMSDTTSRSPACATLIELGRYDQVKTLALPLQRYGRRFRLAYAMALYRHAGASRGEVLEAVASFEELLCKDRRVLGPSHPDSLEVLSELDRARMTLEDYRKFKS